MSAAALGLLLGIVGATCALAAVLAHRMGESRRDVGFMLVAGSVLGASAAVLHAV